MQNGLFTSPISGMLLRLKLSDVEVTIPIRTSTLARLKEVGMS